MRLTPPSALLASSILLATVAGSPIRKAPPGPHIASNCERLITDSGKKLLTIIEGPVHEQTHRLFEGVKSTDLKMLVDVLARIRSRRAELS
jgi:hypothetical protein